MNEEEFNNKVKIIREKFNDPRKIKCQTPEHLIQVDEGIHKGGEFFTTENGEIIDLEFHFVDFDEYELAKYIELAENLYEKHRKKISIYLICSRNTNVTVRECPIKSDSDFTIKLYCSQQDPCELILKTIKRKLFNNEVLTHEDIHNVGMLPVMCAKKDRHYYRVESLKIINLIDG